MKHYRKSRRSPSSDANFSFGSGRLYVDNDEYASKKILFDVLAITFERGRGYEGGDRWSLDVKAHDREPEILTLGSNPKRDEQIREAQAHLKRGGVIENVRLHRSGAAYYLVDGNA